MANHSSTKKAIRKTVAKTAVNKNRISRIRTFIKKVEKAVLNKDQDGAKQALVVAQSEIMKGVSAKVLKKNTASRKVRRLAKRVKLVGAANSDAPAKKKA